MLFPDLNAAPPIAAPPVDAWTSKYPVPSIVKCPVVLSLNSIPALIASEYNLLLPDKIIVKSTVLFTSNGLIL